MFAKSKLAVIAVIAALGSVSPALAQSDGRARPFDSYYGRLQTPTYWNGDRQNGRLDPDSPALTGGGSLGYNRSMNSSQ